MNNQKLKDILKDPKTNWKYIAVVAILAFIAGAVIMNYLSKTGFEIPQITLPKRIDEIANWKTYRNEEYGFEFKYPAEISPVTYSPLQGEGGLIVCFVTSYFYEREIVGEATKAPSGFSYLNLCITNGESLTKGDRLPLLEELPRLRYDPSLAELFQEIKIDDLRALELVNHPEYKNILFIELPSGIFVELVNMKILKGIDIMAKLKESFTMFRVEL